ncbi:MAG: hypothetical protein KBT02_10225 [Treponema sp.]|nr:hypothetical protein [Candidatus Treponema caballi]
MFNIRFWQFEKRENSTKRPDYTTGIVVPAALKDPCSAMRPTFSINAAVWPDGNPSQFNYCYVPTMGRHYFIRDWTYDKGLWHASMECDVLATYRTEIGNSQQYVLRAAAQSDGAIPDMLYPTKQGVQHSIATGTTPWVQSFGLGSYVVGIINGDANGVGAVHYYVFTPSEFNALCQALMDDVSWMNISDISEDLTKALFNPFQYIASCTWLPFNANDGTQPQLDHIKFGWWDFGVACHRIPAVGYVSFDVPINVPKHPQAATRGSYLNGSPYSSYMLTFPAFGNFLLDANQLHGLSTIHCLIGVDIISGDAELNVTDGSALLSSNHLATVKSQVGVPIQLAQLTSNMLDAAGGIISSGVNMGIGIATGNVLGAIANGLGMIGNAVQGALPSMETRGSNGSLANVRHTPRIDASFYKVVDENNEHRGRPLCKDVQIKTLSGYVLCLDADMSLPAPADENRRVKEYLEAGFFWE